jgi:hypothetical protein
MRVIDRDLIRGGHYGQRPHVPHTQAEHMGAPTNAVEMLFAHLKHILKLDRLRLRGYFGAHDEFTLAAAAQNLRKLAKLATHPPPLALQVA